MDGTGERPLTHLNAELLERRALPALDHLSFPGAEGAEIEGWLLRPPDGRPPYPTVLCLHGGPNMAWGHIFSFDFQMLAGAGYAVLLPNPRGSTGYSYEFATACLANWGDLDYRDVMAAVDHAVARGLADPSRLACWGLSYGGYLASWIVGHTDRIKAAVIENPVTNLASAYGTTDVPGWLVESMGGRPHEVPEVYRRLSPITYAHRCVTPSLLILGEHDYRCPAEQGEQFYTALKAAGCPVEMLRLPLSPHGCSSEGDLRVRRAQNEAMLDWFRRYVPGRG